MSEAISIILLILLILTGLYGVATVGIWSAERKCRRMGELIELETRYDRTGGCFIRHDGRWKPLQGFRYSE